jgi:hypothetical protein
VLEPQEGRRSVLPRKTPTPRGFPRGVGVFSGWGSPGKCPGAAAPRPGDTADRETPRTRPQHCSPRARAKTARRKRVRRGAPGTCPIPGSAVLSRIRPYSPNRAETPLLGC